MEWQHSKGEPEGEEREKGREIISRNNVKKLLKFDAIHEATNPRNSKLQVGQTQKDPQ